MSLVNQWRPGLPRRHSALRCGPPQWRDGVVFSGGYLHEAPLVQESDAPRSGGYELLAGKIAQQASDNFANRSQMPGQFFLRQMDQSIGVRVCQKKKYEPFLLRQAHRSLENFLEFENSLRKLLE